MSTPLRLWGFNGTLRGNEARAHLVLPALERDTSIWIPRETHWNPQHPTTGSTLSVEQARDVLTPTPEVDLSLQPGQWILVVGGAYLGALERLGLKAHLTDPLPLHPLHDGSWLAAAWPDAWKLLAGELHHHARRLYTDALKAGTAAPTSQAGDAWIAMHGTGLWPDRDAALLQIVHDRWTGRPDHAANMLHIAETLLGFDAATLDKEADTLLRSVRMNQKRSGGPSEAPSPAPRHPRASPLLDSLDQAA